MCSFKGILYNYKLLQHHLQLVWSMAESHHPCWLWFIAESCQSRGLAPYFYEVPIQSQESSTIPSLPMPLSGLTPKGQMPMWRPKKTSGHAIVNVIFT
jgi:hypothetical protein